MKKLYFSAAVKLENRTTCVIGIMVLTEKKQIDIGKMKCLYEFIVTRYFGHTEIKEFGKISEKDFKNKTNLTINTLY